MTLSEKARLFKIESPEDNYQSIENVASSLQSVIKSEITAQVQMDLDIFSGELAESINSSLLAARNSHDDEARQINAAKRKRYYIVAFSTTFVVTNADTIFYHSTTKAPTSLAGNILLGIGANIIFNGLTFMLAKWRESAPKIISKHREKIEIEMKEQIRKETDARIKVNKFESLDEKSVSRKILISLHQILEKSSESWQTAAKDDLVRLKELNSEYLKRRSEYHALVDEMRTHFLGYFSDASKNLDILIAVAKTIKEQAIEPTFELLDETRVELESVREGVGKVEFS